MPPRCHHLAALLLAIAGCASRPVTVVARPSTASDAALTLAPASLRVVHAGRVECTLSADGRIEIDGREFARVEGSRVVSADGRELARVDGSTVHFAGASSPATLANDGSMTGPDGQRMALDGEGRPAFTSPAHPGETRTLATHVEGVTPASRVTALVLVGVLMFRARAMRADVESP